MKNIKKVFMIFALTAFTLNLNAQILKLTEGDLSFLKGVKELKLQFTYGDMKVGKYTESEYVAKKKTEYNESEAGRGDKWEKMWFEDREIRFEPKFEELFLKYINDKVDAGQHVDAEYTMIIHTYFTEPGYFIGISSAPAFINCEAIFVKTSNPGEKLAVINVSKSPGNSGADWDTGERIKEAYAKAGKEIAKFLLDKKLF